MEVAGFVIGLHDAAVICFLCYQSILIARLALKKLKKKEAKDVLRKP